MKKKWMNKKFILVLALIAILLVSIPGTISFIVAKTDSLVNIFVPFKAEAGDVVISKEVEHPYGADYKIPQNITFDYEVDLSRFYAGYAVETTAGTLTADENGVIKVTVTPGRPFILKNIDENTKVTITEVGQRPGFSLKGDAAQTVTVDKNAPVQVDYINVYEPKKATLAVSLDAAISKNIAGRDWLPEDAFEFVVSRYEAQDESWEKLGTATIVGTSSEKVVSINELFEDEAFGVIGTYNYRIVELEGDSADMAYDTDPRYLTVEVADDEMDGTLDIREIKVSRGAVLSLNEEKGIYTLNAAFNNIYEKPQLNTKDHFGYIMGYPVDYRTGEPTDDRSLWPVRPEGDITRAEVATFFFRMLTDESRAQYWSKTNNFSDVEESAWYNNAISTLANAGILNGYVDGTFNPNGKITRAELAVIAVRFLHAEEVYEGEDHFSDIADHWAQHEINIAAEKGLFEGYPDGAFSPDQAITRAEAVSVVNRSLERKPHKDHFLPDMAVWPDNMDTSKWYYEDMQEATNSHSYEMRGEGADIYEVWIEILPNRDWTKLEKEWSDSNSVGDGGDVMGN
ncbi:MAG: S-layer homology domain-containing protein [Firmicutes bacterium]|nr:S-layer homology domain-containing protein [Bacillota bacterium]